MYFLNNLIHAPIALKLSRWVCISNSFQFLY